MRRPTRPSRPTRMKRIRERTALSCVSIGTWTRRPSEVTTTATVRRSDWLEVRTIRAVYGARVAERKSPNVLLHERSGKATCRARAARLPSPGRRPDVTNGRRLEPTAVRMLVRRCESVPAVARLDDECGARERHQGDDDPEVRRLDDVLHGYDHRIPAPTVRAMALSAITAQVKRARIAFTVPLSQDWATGRQISAAGRPPRVRRSLALRPRLTTGLPWTISGR
jgi:hypothetical protein